MQYNYFTHYFLREEALIVGPLYLEHIQQLFFQGLLKGDTQYRIGDGSWGGLSDLIPDYDSFRTEQLKGAKLERLLERIQVESTFKVKIDNDTVLGPLNGEKLLEMIHKGQIQEHHKIMINRDEVPFRRISDRLPSILEGLQDDLVDESDFDALQAVDFGDLADVSGVFKSEIVFQEEVSLAVEDRQGLLSTKPLFSLLFTYLTDKVSGTLIIEKGTLEYKMTLSKGKMAYIETNEKRLSLGAILKREKGLNIPDNLLALTDTMLIPQLMGLQLIEPSGIFEYLNEAVMLRFKEMLTLTNGKFLFQEESLSKSATNLNIELLKRFWKITNKYIDEKIIETYLKEVRPFVILKDDHRFKYITHLQLGPSELKLASKINNRTTTDQFIGALKDKGKYLEIFKRLVFLLYQLRFIKKGAEKITETTLQELREYQAWLKKIEDDQNYFHILGLTESAESKDVRKTYLKYAKEFHPDKLNREKHPELKQLKTDVFTWISTAYNKLSSQDKVEAYREEMNYQDDTGGVEFTAEMMFQADELFNVCKTALKAGRFPKALEVLEEAMLIMPGNVDFEVYHYFITFILKRDVAGVAQQSIKQLEAVLKDYPSMLDAYRFLGRIYKLTNKKDLAKQYFSKLLEIAPYDPEGKRETR